MAKPVKRRAQGAGALQLLEDGVHLFRAASLTTLCWHWAGSVPFVVAAAMFWNDMTHPRTAESRFVIDALVLAVLLAWMNLCRAVYASRLRSHLAGEAVAPPRFRELRSALIVQTFAGATKLWVLPFALLSVFLLAPAVSFYRNTLVLAARPGVTPIEALARARRYASYRPAQNWKAVGLLLCLFPFLLINLVLVLAFLPQLLRTLTGYESVFARLGTQLLDSGTFWVAAFAVAWLLFDPYVQAVYCVRCFQAESAETGEDLKANLRVLRSGSKAVACIAAVAMLAGVGRAATQASPDDLKRAVEQAAKSPEYDWRTPPALRKAAPKSWLASMVERTLERVAQFRRAVFDAIDRFFRWLFRRRSVITESKGGAPPTTSVPLGVYALIALILAVAGYAMVRSSRAAKRPAIVASGPAVATQRDAEEMDPMRFPEQTWIDLAERAIGDGDYRLAMRAYYLASLAWLGRREFIRIHTGKTNREYQVELGRRTRHAPRARDLFADNIAAVERTWYGMHAAEFEDVEGFRRHMTEMQSALEVAR